MATTLQRMARHIPEVLVGTCVAGVLAHGAVSTLMDARSHAPVNPHEHAPPAPVVAAVVTVAKGRPRAGAVSGVPPAATPVASPADTGLEGAWDGAGTRFHVSLACLQEVITQDPRPDAVATFVTLTQTLRELVGWDRAIRAAPPGQIQYSDEAMVSDAITRVQRYANELALVGGQSHFQQEVYSREAAAIAKAADELFQNVSGRISAYALVM